MGSVEAGASSWVSPANYSPPAHPPKSKTHCNLIFRHNLDESEILLLCNFHERESEIFLLNNLCGSEILLRHKFYESESENILLHYLEESESLLLQRLKKVNLD